MPNIDLNDTYHTNVPIYSFCPKLGISIFVGLVLLIFSLSLISCTPPNNAVHPTRVTPLIGAVEIRELPRSSQPIVDIVQITASIQVDDPIVSIDGRGLSTNLLNLYHCRYFYFDGASLIAATSVPTKAKSTIVLADYSGVSLSTGGDNVLEQVLKPNVSEITIPLALDTDHMFYTLQISNDISLSIWQGQQLDNGKVNVEYTRLKGFKQIHITESHEIAFIRNVPLTITEPYLCD